MLEKENTKTHPALDLRENAVSVPLVHLFFLVIYKSICLFINGKLWDEWKTAQWRRAMKFISSFFKNRCFKGKLIKAKHADHFSAPPRHATTQNQLQDVFLKHV